MNRQSLRQWVLFVVIVAAASVVRVQLSEIPNFAPVAAVALFAGFLFSSRWLALATPLSIMLISDSFLGGYDWRLMVAVYGMLCLPVFLNRVIRQYFDLRSSSGMGTVVRIAGLVGCSLACSLAFFLVTNYVSWLTWYQNGSTSLWQSYVQALPFFRYTVMGDLIFATSLFGAYAAVVSLTTVGQNKPAAKLNVASSC
ncbi:MAG: hypothetical protein KDA87_07695 [Planctomycetales bacterium]|nr:hypothetical protein [Planctomycetales bacterium]